MAQNGKDPWKGWQVRDLDGGAGVGLESARLLGSGEAQNGMENIRGKRDEGETWSEVKVLRNNRLRFCCYVEEALCSALDIWN